MVSPELLTSNGLTTALVALATTLLTLAYARRKQSAETDAITGEELRAIIKSQREYIASLEARLVILSKPGGGL